MGQIIGTSAFGNMEVEKSFSWRVETEEGKIIQQGGHVCLLTNGVGVNSTGLPFSSEKEIKEILSTPDMKAVQAEALEWFRSKDKEDQVPRRKIMFDDNDFPCFVDTGEFVEKLDDIFLCMKQGRAQAVAIIGLNKRLEAKQRGATQKGPENPREATSMAASKPKGNKVPLTEQQPLAG